jgi:hypothetical protein
MESNLNTRQSLMEDSLKDDDHYSWLTVNNLSKLFKPTILTQLSLELIHPSLLTQFYHHLQTICFSPLFIVLQGPKRGNVILTLSGRKTDVVMY